MKLDEVFAGWEDERRARAAQASQLFRARMDAIDDEITANLNVMKAKRARLEAIIDAVSEDRNRAAATTRRIRAERIKKPEPRPPLSDEASLALAAATIAAREAKAHVSMPKLRDPRQTSSQLLEWMNTGRQPRALRTAATTIMRRR